jgi:hypothetical protein
MRTFYWLCENENCRREIEVEPFEPSEALSFRGISCPNCNAFYSVRNLELKVRENQPESDFVV